MRINNSIFALLLTSVCALPHATLADQPNYTYGEVGYTRLNLDDFDADPDGYYLKGSFALGDSGFIRGSYYDVEDEIFGLDIESQSYQLGIGYKTETGPSSSWYLVADYLEAEAEIESIADADENGFQLATGLRGFAADQFELYGELGYVDIEESDGFVGTIGAVYYFAGRFGIVLEGSIDEEDNSAVSAGARMTF